MYVVSPAMHSRGMEVCLISISKKLINACFMNDILASILYMLALARMAPEGDYFEMSSIWSQAFNNLYRLRRAGHSIFAFKL